MGNYNGWEVQAMSNRLAASRRGKPAYSHKVLLLAPLIVLLVAYAWEITWNCLDSYINKSTGDPIDRTEAERQVIESGMHNFIDQHSGGVPAPSLDIFNQDRVHQLRRFIVGHVLVKTRIGEEDLYLDSIEWGQIDNAELLVLLLGDSAAVPNDATTATQRELLRNVSIRYFEFDGKRLTDLDSDGWPEYLTPNLQAVYSYQMSLKADGDTRADSGGFKYRYVQVSPLKP
jgi:hypothetical protein